MVLLSFVEIDKNNGFLLKKKQKMYQHCPNEEEIVVMPFDDVVNFRTQDS